MRDSTFIYALVDPQTRRVRYVGKADRPYRRAARHIYERRSNSSKSAWIEGLAKVQLRPRVLVLEVVPAEKWETAERKWIAQLRASGASLLNICSGGNGATTHTAETRAHLSRILKGRPPAPHVLQAAHTACRGKPSWNAGTRKLKAGRKPLTPEQRRAIGDRSRGRPRSAETRAKISATLMGHAVPAEQRAKTGAKHRGHRWTPEQRARLSALRRAQSSTGGRFKCGSKVPPERIAKRTATAALNRALALAGSP